jgi:hypothetical protein
MAGVAVGVCCTWAVSYVEDELSPYPLTDPGAAQWTCDGAAVIAAAVADGPAVIVTVTVSDERRRDWQVRMEGRGSGVLHWEDEQGYSGLTTFAGDLDDGPTRRVRIRPAGSAPWCEGSVSLT